MLATKVRMSHNGDMDSTGLCLMEKGWFGDAKTGYKIRRIVLFVFLSIFIMSVKVFSVGLVAMQYVGE
jgi:hypothetical protein